MITQLSQTPAGTTDFTLLKDEVTKNAKGINQITLSNYDNDSAPVVKVGSVFENDGATFEVRTSDETPAGYSGIGNSTTFYLYYDASATAFIYDSTAPTWDDAKQGYYHPTNTTDRAFFSMFKDSGGTLYQNKNHLVAQNNYEYPNTVKAGSLESDTLSTGAITATSINTDNAALKMKVVSVTSGSAITVYSASHGLTESNIRGMCVQFTGTQTIDSQSTTSTLARATIATSASGTMYFTIFYV